MEFKGKIKTGDIAATTSQFDKTSSAAMSDIPGLTHQLDAGKTYHFRAWIPIQSGSGNHQIGFGGSCTATSFMCDMESEAFGTGSGLDFKRFTAKSNTISYTVLNGIVKAELIGTIVVNAAGTLTIQFAQDASNPVTSSVLAGAIFEVIEL